MSNAESGTGYSDILVEVGENRTGIAIELKYAEGGDMDAACAEALQQIEEKDYIARLKQDGMQNFIKYGIACFKKNCKVTMGDQKWFPVISISVERTDNGKPFLLFGCVFI